MSNSATRLLNVMDRLNQTKNLKTVLLEFEVKRTFFVENDNVRAAMILGKIYSLFNNVIEDVRAIPNINLSLYLSWVEKVSRGLSSLNLVKTNNVASVLGAHYTGVEKKSLEFCEHELKRVKSKPVFSEKNQKELFKQASILQKNVIDSNDLDPQIKTFIFNKLEDILNAITYYDFTGDEGIINATERAVGACVIHPEFKNSENRNTNCGELIKLLAKTMTIIVTADGFYKISAKVVANLLN